MADDTWTEVEREARTDPEWGRKKVIAFYIEMAKDPPPPLPKVPLAIIRAGYKQGFFRKPKSQ